LWVAGLLPLTANAATAAGCEALAKFKAANPAVVILHAQVQAAGPAPSAPGAPPSATLLPAHCRVDGVIESRTGSDGKTYGIRFALALPQAMKWNGRFLYQGGGGLNGTVNPPIGAAAAGEEPALAQGFAVLSTDSGHEGAVFDSSFFADQQAALNFLYQSIGKAGPVGKQLVAAYYGRPAAHSYFVGCSTGGREAMIASQRYPEVFDGIIAGAPAMRTNYSNLATRWVTTSLNTAAPKDAQGRSVTSQALSGSDRKLVIGALLAACDGNDGIKDGMIFDVRHCAFDPGVLACKAEKTDACLSTVQVAAIKQAFAGPKARDGRQVYPGFAYDTGIAAQGRGIPGLLGGGMSPVGPSPTGTQMDVDAEAAVAHDARSMAGDSNAWTQLNAFAAHGGKLIFYHGVSDPWFSALDTIDYYERLAADNPPAPLADWSRLFLVPGMGHCGGGEATLDRFDLLNPLVNWVEHGQPPKQTVATGTAFPGRSRPLCAYPQHAQYNGQGDPQSAASFSCRD
jgi:feruloyl esterase